MPVSIFDPARHTSLSDVPWSTSRAESAIGAIVGDTMQNACPQGLWRVHPEDQEGDAQTFYDLYLGTAGVVWALDELRRTGATDRAFRPGLDVSAWIEPNRAALKHHERLDGLLGGDTGLLMTQWQRLPNADTADALSRAIEVNSDNPAMELMWGPAGSMLAALNMYALTQDGHWLAHYRNGAQTLVASFCHDAELDVNLWTQALWGRQNRMLGAVHGFAGNALALISGRAHLERPIWNATSLALARTFEKTAIRDESGINWASSVDLTEPGRKLLMQMCHGAPGMIVCMADLDQPIDELLIEAGETVWKAGPLKKGSNLCHGTAGNGFAFLKLFGRTGDELWLTRARVFAMHAMAQNEDEVRRYGMRRYSLWTGDLGLALFLHACMTGTSSFPALDRR